MKWTLRFILFATLFALPCFWLSAPWQRVIGIAASAVLHPFGIDVEMSQLQIMAPFDLGIYLAMCLAGTRAPAIVRRRALEWGLPLLVALEVLTVVVAIAVYFALHGSQDPSSATFRTMEYVLEFVPWASAVTVWLLMLGAWELPLAALVPPESARGAGRATGSR